MKASLVVREVMKVKDVRPSVLCDRLGIKSNVFANRCNQENISIEKLNEI